MSGAARGLGRLQHLAEGVLLVDPCGVRDLARAVVVLAAGGDGQRDRTGGRLSVFRPRCSQSDLRQPRLQRGTRPRQSATASKRAQARCAIPARVLACSFTVFLLLSYVRFAEERQQNKGCATSRAGRSRSPYSLRRQAEGARARRVALAVTRRLRTHASRSVFWLIGKTETQWRYRAGFSPGFPRSETSSSCSKHSTISWVGERREQERFRRPPACPRHPERRPKSRDPARSRPRPFPLTPLGILRLASLAQDDRLGPSPAPRRRGRHRFYW